jgi:cystathionine beta-synthase
MAAYRSVLDSIGNTPLVELTRFDIGPCRLFAKLENQNPAGSIKDRIGLSLIEAAERDGKLGPGGTLIEATAGNTGLGLALVAAQKGYRLILIVPDKMSQEKVLHLKALGADVRITRSDVGKGHPDYYQDVAERLAAEMGAFYVNQFANPANPLAHETTTGPEIWQQSGHRLDAVVCGVGSGGTLTGLGRFFQRVATKVEMVLADPEGSILAPLVESGKKVEAGSWLIEGIGEDFIPPVCDLAFARRAYAVSDRESFAAARELLRREGILGGSSTGTLLAAALRYCREQREAKHVVTLVCDSGNKYLSKMYNDFWMFDQGLLDRAEQGDLTDLIARRHAEGSVVTVTPDDTLATVYRRMKRGRQGRRHHRRVGPAARRQCRSRGIPRAGAPRHGDEARDRHARGAARIALADLCQGPCARDREGRQVHRPYHAYRFHQPLAPARQLKRPGPLS